MAYLSTFFEIDRLLKLEEIFMHFSELLDETDLVIIISEFLTVKELVALLSVQMFIFRLTKKQSN